MYFYLCIYLYIHIHTYTRKNVYMYMYICCPSLRTTHYITHCNAHCDIHCNTLGPESDHSAHCSTLCSTYYKPHTRANRILPQCCSFVWQYQSCTLIINSEKTPSHYYPVHFEKRPVDSEESPVISETIPKNSDKIILWQWHSFAWQIMVYIYI